MKTQVSPPVIAAVIIVVVVAISVFIFKKSVNNDPTPRPDPKYFGVSNSGAPSQTPPTKP